MENRIRTQLPNKAIELFDSIVNGTVLGASNHIKMIAQIYCEIASDLSESEAKPLIHDVHEFFIETRGKSSYAIVTALNLIAKDIENVDAEPYSKKVEKGVEQYFLDADQNTKNVIRYSANLLDHYKTVMAFDYSSTVEKALLNTKEPLNVILPESRVINGGYPFVKSFVEKGHHIHFIPDADMLTVLKEVDAIVIGAETFYPDGTAFNTAGSDILAELANIYHVPYYVLTPLLKADLRAMYGQYKDTIYRDMKDVIAKDWPAEIKDKVDFKIVELTAIRPELITGYVTEEGIVKPSALLELVR